MLVISLLGMAGLGAQTEATAAETTEAVSAPVIIDGEELFRLRGITSYPAHQRAQVVRERIIDLAQNRALNPADLRAVEDEGLTRIMIGDQLVLGW